MSELSKLIMEVYFDLKIKVGSGLSLEFLQRKIPYLDYDSNDWGVSFEELLMLGYLEIKDNNIKFFYLTQIGGDYSLDIKKETEVKESTINVKNQINGIKAHTVHVYQENVETPKDKKEPTSHKILLNISLIVGILASIVTVLIFLGIGPFKREVQEKQLVEKQKDMSCPSTVIEVVQLSDRALWEWTHNWGDRAIYENLMRCQDKIESLELKNEIIKKIKGIKSNYRTSILVPRVDSLPSVCQLHSMKGESCILEPATGFNAINVVQHLDITKYPEAISRVRAVCILRNIKTAIYKDQIDMVDVVETLIFMMKEDPSLLVSKLLLDRYSQFTGFSPTDVFDFKSAITDRENRLKEGQSLVLSDYCFQADGCKNKR